MRRIDTCSICKKENVECDVTQLITGEEIIFCDQCLEELQNDLDLEVISTRRQS